MSKPVTRTMRHVSSTLSATRSDRSVLLLLNSTPSLFLFILKKYRLPKFQLLLIRYYESHVQFTSVPEHFADEEYLSSTWFKHDILHFNSF